MIVRVDGRAFHTFTRRFERPFDYNFAKTMWETAEALVKEVSGCKLAYVQSDEISLLITNDDSLVTEPWFANNLQKIVSLTASIATLAFNKNISKNMNCPSNCLKAAPAMFDSRVFLLPEEEVANYFIWRQNDAARNSIQMVARSLYSHNELNGCNCDTLQDMIVDRGQNWNDYPTWCKRGICLVKRPSDVPNRLKWYTDLEIPIFTKDRNYIENEFRK